MYKLLSSGAQQAIMRLADSTCIPFDSDNTDYQEYLEWVAAGNTPEPAEEASE